MHLPSTASNQLVSEGKVTHGLHCHCKIKLARGKSQTITDPALCQFHGYIRTTTKETLGRDKSSAPCPYRGWIEYWIEYKVMFLSNRVPGEQHQNPSSLRVISTILNSFSLYSIPDFSNPLVEDYEFSSAAVLCKKHSQNYLPVTWKQSQDNWPTTSLRENTLKKNLSMVSLVLGYNFRSSTTKNYL